MNKQQFLDATDAEVVEFICEKLDAQGAKSMDTMGLCNYRDGKGNKCAVGHIIPDDIYDYEMDRGCGCTIDKIVSSKHKLLIELQTCHDSHWRPEIESFTSAWVRMLADNDE